MKRVVILSISFLFTVGLMAQKPVKKAAPVFKNLLDSFSYAAGYNVATNMKQQNISRLNLVLFRKAIEDAFADKNSLLTKEEISMSLQFQLEAFRKEKLKKEKEIGRVFLEANKKKNGVIELPSGLQYEVLKSGEPNAARPKPEDSVIVHYIGAFVDGKEFNNSFKLNAPARFAVSRVIRGWTEALLLMKVGDRWKIAVPSDLAYGDEGKGSIPAGATLVFEINLEGIISMEKKSGQ